MIVTGPLRQPPLAPPNKETLGWSGVPIISALNGATTQPRSAPILTAGINIPAFFAAMIGMPTLRTRQCSAQGANPLPLLLHKGLPLSAILLVTNTFVLINELNCYDLHVSISYQLVKELV